MQGTVRVLLVDDHVIMRVGLASVISSEPGLEVCGEAGTGAEAIAMYRALRPEVVIMDLRLPDMSGVEATTAIRAEFSEARIAIVSTFAREDEVYSAISAGARGYVLKTLPCETLIEVIRTVAAGRRYLPGDIAARLADRVPRSELTPREKEVLARLVLGKKNQQIAEDLGISDGTVKVHMGNILLKLGAADRTEAVTVAIVRGIVHVD
jgi:two-component system NarL family response regulator